MRAPSPRTRLRRLHDKAAYDADTIKAVLDAQPLAHIAHLVDGVPAATFFVVALPLVWRYPLTAARHKIIRARFEARLLG